MPRPSVSQVFGVSTEPVLSYVARDHVDDAFQRALDSNKQIVVYGASKQGKTALVSKYAPYDDNVVVRLTPAMELTDIYTSVVRQSGITLLSATVEKSGREFDASISTKIKAMIPLFGAGEAEAKGSAKSKFDREQTHEEVPFNLALAQDIGELLIKVGSEKFIILENFHYLDDDRQREFAFDLRTFQELGIRFIILGVWRERNRLVQFNGDLLDRLEEVPVEPWRAEDFHAVAAQGAEELEIDLGPALVTAACDNSFGSIGVFQELMKAVCEEAVLDSRPQGDRATLNDPALIGRAAAKKAGDYSVRHQRALEAIAAGHISSTPSGELLPLFLPYYLVRTVLEAGHGAIEHGMPRSELHERIRSIHHRGGDVRASDMSNLLHNLAQLQAKKDISPPIIDYDRTNRRLQVVDSTFHFFMRNANVAEIVEEIPNPLDGLAS